MAVGGYILPRTEYFVKRGVTDMLCRIYTYDQDNFITISCNSYEEADRLAADIIDRSHLTGLDDYWEVDKPKSSLWFTIRPKRRDKSTPISAVLLSAREL